MGAWKTIDLEHPMRSVRAASGLGQTEAQVALSTHRGYPVAASTFTSAELKGANIRLDLLLERAAALGMEIEIRARRT